MRGKFGVLTGIAVALLAAFGGVDYAAHATHYAHGETFSALVWNLSGHFWEIRVLVGAAVTVLFTHLVFRKP